MGGEKLVRKMAEQVVRYDRINYYLGGKPMTDTVIRVTNNNGMIQVHLASGTVLEYEYNQLVSVDTELRDLAYNLPIREQGQSVGGVSIE
jgi:hypothetical protein